jgi:multidrug efflux pump subunit AcrB
MLASRWLRLPPGLGERKKYLLERVVDVFYRPIERLYLRVLGFAMDHRWVVVVAAVATLGSCVPLFKAVPKGFLPKNDEAQFEISLRTPEGTSLAATRLAAERMARAVRTWPQVSATMMTIGDNAEKTPNLAKIFVRLTPPDRRKISQDELQEKVRKELVPLQPPEFRIGVSAVAAFSGGGTSAATVQYIMTGPDLTKLTQYSEQALVALKAIPGAVDADTSLIVGNPEVEATVSRRKASDLGVNVADVATTAQLLVGGVKVSRYEESGYEYDILVRADDAYRTSQESLGLMSVPSVRLGTVPLLDVVDLKRALGPSQITRYARQRQVTFTANTSPGVGSGEVGAAFEKAVAALKLPPEYRFVPFGQSKEIGRTARNFAIAFGLAFVFMYLILAAQFESWLHPVTILLALPLTVPFALASLLILGQGLDIFTLLGILVLFGVVKKNAILQIDHIIQLRAQGLSRREAILRGNKHRLRPILMTTAAFVAGMLPLVVSKGIGAEFNRATAGPVVGGQILSLLLTLLATPVAYSLFDDAANGLRRLFRLKARPDAETGADEVRQMVTPEPVPQAEPRIPAQRMGVVS